MKATELLLFRPHSFSGLVSAAGSVGVLGIAGGAGSLALPCLVCIVGLHIAAAVGACHLVHVY
jgi:hypothetical protein